MTNTTKNHSLVHHFLMPTDKMTDERFFDALLYICRHTKDGAWGFIINKPLESISVGSLLSELDLPTSRANMNTQALDGGPVREEAGFVLHTGLPDYKSSFAISENICLTTSKDILEKLSHDKLEHYLLCMGYCQWGKGQLDQEIALGDWWVCPADLGIIFGLPFQDRLTASLAKLGIDINKFVNQTGSA